MRALAALPFLLLAFVPPSVAHVPPVPDPIGPVGCLVGSLPTPDVQCESSLVDYAVASGAHLHDHALCLFQPVIPETPLYYVVWHCTGHQAGLPEPIYLLTGCTLGFPITNVECEPSPQQLILETVEDVHQLAEGVVWCLLGDYYFPETPLYYILWGCTAGQLGVPEPIYALTGCTIGFPITNVECEQPPQDVLAEAVDEAVLLLDSVVECLVAPYIPETPLYYILWACTAGQLGVPEPIYALTGCRMGFPATDIQC